MIHGFEGEKLVFLVIGLGKSGKLFVYEKICVQKQNSILHKSDVTVKLNPPKEEKIVKSSRSRWPECNPKSSNESAKRLNYYCFIDSCGRRVALRVTSG